MVKARAALEEIRICEHGGKLERNEKDEIIDFSGNLNPYGPPHFISDAIREAIEEIRLYPDTECRELRAKLAERFGCEQREILVGAGVSELIPLITLSFVKKRVLIPRHTYGEYELAARIMGAKIERIAMPELRINPELIANEMKPDDVVFLCNPNNPTGQYLGKDEIELIVEAAERVDALVMLDEAYVDFVRNAFPAHDLPTRNMNMIILRSLTKSFGMPGVRIGYAIGSADHIREMRKIKVPWSVSVFAQKIGAAVIGAEGDEFLAQTRVKIERNKRRIEEAFRVHSDANYYILDVGNAAEVKRVLLKEGVVVRDCTSFDLPSHIRFSVRREGENDLLIRHLMSFFQ